MIRDFTEEKKEEIFRILDEIDMKEWKPFMEWCGSSAEEFGDWPERLNVSAYTRYVDEYHKKVLELNEMTRQQVNTVFENVAEIDARYAERMRECQEKIKEQIAMVNTMSEFMQSMMDGNPNMALIAKGSVNENCVRMEDETKDTREGKVTNRRREEKLESEMPGWNDMFPIAGVEMAFETEMETGTYIVPEVDDTPETNDEDMEILERYVDEEFLRNDLGWDIDTAEKILDKNFIEDMSELMLEYGLTDEKSILFFLMTVTIESNYGKAVLEDRDVNLYNGLSYTYNTRGAGLIQLTGADQREFLEYMLEHTEDEEEKEILNRYIQNFVDIDLSEKHEVWDNPLDRLHEDEQYKDLPSVADYIAENYPIESALWYWCVQNKASIDGEGLSLNECIETYGDSADPFMMYVGVQCAVNGSEFKPRGIGRFFRYWNWIEISDDTYWQKITTEDGKVIYKKHEEGSIILYYSDTENGDKEPPVYSYKPNGLPARITIYENVMGPINET